MDKQRRVVITGLGTLTPIGDTVPKYWEALSAGVSGAAPISRFDASNFKTKFACELKNYDPLNHFEKKDARKIDDFAQYAMVAAQQAVEDSKLDVDTVDKNRVGVIWGAGIGGIQTFQEEVLNYSKGGRFNPFFIPKLIIDIAPGLISIKYGFRGPNFGTVSACSSSANAIIDAYNCIKLDYADVIVTGGSEAAVTEAGVGGFNALHALSTRNEDPKTASRPFDKDRDGFVLGEGSASLVLEEYEHAKARGVTIYAELIGCGLSADAHHMTAPHPDGVGVIAVMETSLKRAGVNPTDVDAINSHGTSTSLGDMAEIKAISHVFGEHAKSININSTKSMTGHLLGAAGAVEAVASILSMKYGLVPPTINHTNYDENIDSSLNLTLNKAQKREINVIMSNNFAFGGHNACIIFRKI